METGLELPPVKLAPIMDDESSDVDILTVVDDDSTLVSTEKMTANLDIDAEVVSGTEFDELAGARQKRSKLTEDQPLASFELSNGVEIPKLRLSLTNADFDKSIIGQASSHMTLHSISECRPDELLICSVCQEMVNLRDLSEYEGVVPLYGDLKATYTCGRCAGGLARFNFPTKRSWAEIAFVALVNLAIQTDGTPNPIDGSFHHLQTVVDNFIQEHFTTLCAGYSRNCWKSRLASALNRLPSHFEHSEGQQGKGWWRVRSGAAYPTPLDVLHPQPKKNARSPWSRSCTSSRSTIEFEPLLTTRKNKKRPRTALNSPLNGSTSSLTSTPRSSDESDTVSTTTEASHDISPLNTSSSSSTHFSVNRTASTPRLRTHRTETFLDRSGRSQASGAPLKRKIRPSSRRNSHSGATHAEGRGRDSEGGIIDLTSSSEPNLARTRIETTLEDNAITLEWRLVETLGSSAVNFVNTRLRFSTSTEGTATLIREFRRQYEAAEALLQLGTGTELPLQVLPSTNPLHFPNANGDLLTPTTLCQFPLFSYPMQQYPFPTYQNSAFQNYYPF